ncbi:MAG: hypothetical protein HYX27_23000 [Acidobacteria bacterium]|nr:hypothetical protein [Acidobacteriota bacterium]
MSESHDPGTLWRNQPVENLAVNLERLTNRRTQRLFHSTRCEILVSICAAFFFTAGLNWRLASYRDPLPLYGLAAVVLWSAITIYVFRDRIWNARPDALFATGVDHYRRLLERRRDHLRNVWIWHGPLYLAIALFVAVGIKYVGLERLRNAIPFLSLLVLWIVFGVVWRHRQAAGLQSEIDELKGL